MEVFNIISEVTIVAAPVVLVWSLQTSWNRKGMVVTAFALRLSCVIPFRMFVTLSDFEYTDHRTASSAQSLQGWLKSAKT